MATNNPFIARELDFAEDYISMLVYGDFGSGKTYFAGSSVLVPEYRDILYITLEGGEKGLKPFTRVKDIQAEKHFLVIPVQTFKQYGNVYEFLKLHIKFRDADDTANLIKLEAQIRGVPESQIKEPKKIHTVIVDSLTEAQKYCMYQLLGIDPLVQRIDQEPDQAQFQDWGRSREMIQFLIRRLRDLPVNSIFICGQDTDQDAAKNWYYTPLLPGKLAGDIRGLVDCVGYLTVIPLEGGDVNRRMFLVGGKYGNANITAKHRFGTLKSPYLENPTMADIRNLDRG